jgi:hypothetical protein
MAEASNQCAGLGAVAWRCLGHDGACRDPKMKETGSSKAAIADSMELMPVARVSVDLEELQASMACCRSSRMMIPRPGGDGDGFSGFSGGV